MNLLLTLHYAPLPLSDSRKSGEKERTSFHSYCKYTDFGVSSQRRGRDGGAFPVVI